VLTEPLPNPQSKRARSLLEQDRAWCAYALADLEPPFVERTSWFVGTDAVVMVYRGLTPPLLFAHGEPDEVDQLLSQVPPGTYQYGLQATHRARLTDRLVPARETHMWRMVLRREDFPKKRARGAEGLAADDLLSLLALFGEHADRPDSFDAGQLESGVFFGIHRNGKLVSVAGTHVIGRAARAAAVGNVFTHPDHRRRGYGKLASAAVVETLLGQGLETIVLNVAMANAAALGLYRDLGFWPFCGYYEGLGELLAD
jgi:ribosomal protein S18 acetylase RimI-like enzyme